MGDRHAQRKDDVKTGLLDEITTQEMSEAARSWERGLERPFPNTFRRNMALPALRFQASSAAR